MSFRTCVLRRVVFLLVGCGLISVGGCAGCEPIFKFHAGPDVTTTVGTPIVLTPILDNIPHDIQWSPTSNLSDPRSDTPTFIASQVGDYTFTVTITYHLGGRFGDTTFSDTVVVHVTGSKGPIFANAGPDLEAPLNVATTLQGAASGGSGVYTFAWKPTAGLSDPSVAQPTFTPTTVGDTVFTLTVTDSEGSTATDTVTVMAFRTRLSGLVWQPNATAGYQLLATFSDNLDPDTAQTASNYRDHASNTPATSAVLQADQRSVLVTFTNVALASASTFDIGVGGGLKDSEGFVILAAADRSATQNPADMTAPTVLSRTWAANAGAGNQVIVQFSEAMDRLTAQDTSNYRLNGIVSPQSAVVAGDGQSVTLTFVNVAASPNATLDAGLNGSVHDINGQLLAASTNQPIFANASDLTAPGVVSATHAAQFTSPGYQISVLFNEAMSAADVQNPAGYRINGVAATTAVLATDAPKVTLLFMTPIATTDHLDIGASGTVKDINGNAASPASVAIGANAGDVTGPGILARAWRADTSNYQLTVVYNESVDKTTATAAANYAMQTPGGAVNPTAASLSNDGKTVTLTFDATGAGLSRMDTLTVSSGVQDINGQANTSTAAAAVTANPADHTSPTITSRVWDANATQYRVLITFDQALDRQSATTTINYLLQGNDGVDPENPTSVSLDTTGRVVTLTFGTSMAGFANGDNVSASSNILDVNGQMNASVSSENVDPNPADTTGPTVAGFSRVDAAHADVTFSEVMDKQTAEAAPFYIMHGGDAQVIAAVLSADGRTVRLTTDTDPVGGTVTISNFVLDINARAPASSLTAGPF